jgi:hypothetical protein
MAVVLVSVLALVAPLALPRAFAWSHEIEEVLLNFGLLLAIGCSSVDPDPIAGVPSLVLLATAAVVSWVDAEHRRSRLWLAAVGSIALGATWLAVMFIPALQAGGAPVAALAGAGLGCIAVGRYRALCGGANRVWLVALLGGAAAGAIASLGGELWLGVAAALAGVAVVMTLLYSLVEAHVAR